MAASTVEHGRTGPKPGDFQLGSPQSRAGARNLLVARKRREEGGSWVTLYGLSETIRAARMRIRPRIPHPHTKRRRGILGIPEGQRMKWLLLVVLSGTAVCQESGSMPKYDRGATLFEQCRASVRAQDAATNALVRSQDMVAASICVSYISGFLDGAEMSGKFLCMSDTSASTLARVYVAYMEKHPNTLDVEKQVGLINALLDAYSCSLPKKR